MPFWADALEGGDANHFGAAYNPAVWGECRNRAVAYLDEARNKLGMSGSNAIEEAIDAYATSRDQLKIVSEQFPFSGHDPEHLKETTRVRRSVEALRNTVIAEQRAISALQDILAT